MKAQNDDDSSPIRYAHGMRTIPKLSDVKAKAPNLPASAQKPLPRLSVTLPLRLLTPIIGGGVRPMEPDRAQPVRVTALRGALRWWWRALQATQSLDELREDERLLFGGVSRGGGDDNVPSLVRVGVRVTRAPTLVTAGHHKDKGGRLDPQADWVLGRELGYGLFPLQLPRAALLEWSQKHPNQAAPTQSVITSLEFELTVELDREALWRRVQRFADDKVAQLLRKPANPAEFMEAQARATPEAIVRRAQRLAQDAVAALRWWLHWGGVGARTRRGFGAVALRAPADVRGGEGHAALPALADANTFETLPQLPELPPEKRPNNRPTLFGARLLRRVSSSGANDPSAEHRLLVGALRDMRQREGYARDAGSQGRPGQTRWPEAELMKHRLVNNAPGMEHRQQVPAQDRPRLSAPRAAFGLPIVMHFKDRGDGQANGQIIPIAPSKTDRWASPLLLRPQQLPRGQIAAGVLILSGAAVPGEVEVQGTRGQPCSVRGAVGARGEVAQDLQANGGDALAAFSRRIQGTHGFKPEPS